MRPNGVLGSLGRGDVDDQCVAAFDEAQGIDVGRERNLHLPFDAFAGLTLRLVGHRLAVHDAVQMGQDGLEIVLSDHLRHVLAENAGFAETKKLGVLRIGKSAHEVAIEVDDHRRDVLGDQVQLHLA